MVAQLEEEKEMLNLYEAVRRNPTYSKLEIDGLLFAEYTCGVTAKKLPNWTQADYLVHVITGRKTWHTPDGVWTARPGETLFFKKGATIVEQHFEKEMCLLMLFIPDALVRGAVREVSHALGLAAAEAAPIKTALRVNNDVALSGFFQSMRAYLAGREKPPAPLVKLKLRELVMSILAGEANAELAAHFHRIGATNAPALEEIMEANFRYNLSLQEYAQLCHRSLSSFKREFQARFSRPPGKWLLQRRLDYSAGLLRHSALNISEIAFQSGFEDVSHFSRVFKARFGVSPAASRRQVPVPA